MRVFDRDTGEEIEILSELLEDWPFGYPALVIEWIIVAYMVERILYG